MENGKRTIDENLLALDEAAKKCWEVKVEAYDIAKICAPLCLHIVNLLGVPYLTNQKLEQRSEATRFKPGDIEFWEDLDIVIALADHYHQAIELAKEGADASTN